MISEKLLPLRVDQKVLPCAETEQHKTVWPARLFFVSYIWSSFVLVDMGPLYIVLSCFQALC